MADKSAHTIPSKEKLLAFVQGGLSAKERMDIAKAMEENPMLADVVEGLRLSQNAGKNIRGLENKVREKYTNRKGGKIITFQSKAVLAAAASVLLLISVGIYNKMMKLDEERVVSEQLFKNTEAPQAVIKSAEGAASTELEQAEENLISEEEIQQNAQSVLKLKTEDFEIADKKDASVDSDGEVYPQEKVEMAKVADELKQETTLAEEKRWVSEKKEVASGTTTTGGVVYDADKVASIPAFATTTVSTKESPYRKEKEKTKSERANSQTRDAVQQAPVTAVAEEQENDNTKKTLARPAQDMSDPFNQAIALHKRKNNKEAVALLDSLSKSKPENIEYKYHAGVFSYEDKAYTKAIDYLAPLLSDSKNKYFDAAQWYTVLSHKALGNTDKAKKLLSEIAAKNNGYQQMAADTLKTMP
jgi:tetratricopeptide (TPR) repeat protein